MRQVRADAAKADAAKEVAMENEQTTNFTPLADEAFLSLGAEQVAYVKAINLPDGAHAIGIFSADGKPMAAAPSVEVAQALIRQHDLEPALVH
jgi:hypothetical protein